MSAAARLLLLTTVGMLIPGASAQAQPDPNDTRLLSMPAVSAKQIAFVYSEDLWTADIDGKNPRRLTSDIGVESNPVFSPDGKTIAFSAQYDGNTDVYTIPATGGTPTRLTTHPAPDVVRGFTPDGGAVLFSSNRHVYTNRHSQLFTVPLTGGMPTQLPIPWGFEAAYSPDGSHIAYTPVRDATAQWKNYRGGTHSRVWIYNVKTHDVVEIPQPNTRCNDMDPNWVGNTLYFRSDRGGEYNVFAYDPAAKNGDAKEVKQVTKFTDFPVLDIATDGKQLLFEQAGYLHLMGSTESSPGRLKIGIATDTPEARARFAKGSKYVRGASISPAGSRVAVEFRGEIVTVPAEKGDPRNLTNSPGVHDRDPSWSPDGKTIAYISDEGGEYQLVLAPQSGKGETRKVKLTGAGFYQDFVWSRDSKKILYRDNASTLYWMDVESGKTTKIVSAQHGAGRGMKASSWSPDSKWVTYAINTPAQISRVYAYSLEKGESIAVTDGLTEAVEPVFDANGKYLYFLGSNDTGMSKHGFSQSASDARQPRWTVNLVVLKSDLPSPFLRESDEEKGEQAAVPTPKGAKKDDAAFTIDFDGLGQRILSFPLQPGNYSGLHAGAAGQLFYLTRPEIGAGGGTLMRYDIERRNSATVQAGVTAYELTPDGRKMLYSTGGGNWFVAPTTGSTAGASTAAAPTGGGGGRGRGPTAPAPVASPSGDGKLNLEAIEVKLDPRAEWKQIFEEAWRINRDYFYDPNMHGADWPAMKKKYEAFIPHATNGGDVYKVIRWMLSELAVGHSYMTPGERLHDKKTTPGGLLGADYEVADGRYRFKKVYGGLNWSAASRSPLTAPGVNVKEGEFLLAVNGKELKAPTEVYSLFENTAGKLIDITVGPTADGKGSRTVSVEPIASELSLRNMDWVEGNLRKVEKATGGQVGYVYVRDTAAGGMADFKRYFFPQVDKDALIVDERFNSGGQFADYYIDILRRPFTSYWSQRHTADQRTPSAAVFGPKVMLIDEGAGSGGDLLPYMFKKFNLGPLVGKRTWGGLVGIGGYPSLMDGGSVTAPHFAFWTPEDGFGIENVGVAPDYDVTLYPKDVIAGKDAQLDKAIELALEALKKNPPKKDARPAYPKRVIPQGP
ncbi:MAG TPA: PDZ domain-containing protein [Gemmataceae bacterium]|nr:PDZ domain-containing protein [Gemmataceae bacterium]